MKPLAVIASLPAAAALMLGVLICGAGSTYGAWQVVWADEFSGASVDTTKWAFETGNGNNGWGNWEREYYTSRTTNAYVASGALHIVARQESMGGFPYTSARMKTQGLFSHKYGRFEFRAKLPQGLGFWPALWMMGTNITSVGWPACGEIDVMENKGSSSSQVGGALHYSDSNNNHLQQDRTYTVATSVTNFHTYAVEWTTNSIKWIVDGTTVQTWTSWSSSTGPYPAPFNQPFFIIMNLAVGGGYLGYPSDAEINANTVFPGEMQVDYVRVYDYVVSVPDAPTGLSAVAGGTQVVLSWLGSAGATNYNIKFSTTNGGPYTTIASTAATGYTNTGLANGTTYYYVLAAVNSFGEGANSAQVSATTTVPPANLALNKPVAVSSVENAGLTGANAVDGNTATRWSSAFSDPQWLYVDLQATVNLNRVKLNWEAAYGRSYQIQISSNAVDWTPIYSTTTSTGGIQDLTGLSGTGRYVRMYGTVRSGVYGYSLWELEVYGNIAAPTGLAATAGDQEVFLNWNAIPAATSYHVKRSTTNGGPYTTVASPTTPGYTDTGLVNGTPYYYVVSQVNPVAESTNSIQVSATPICTPPPAPTAGNNGPVWAGMTLNLTASSVPGATYNWTGPDGFTSTNQNPSITNATTNLSGLFSVRAATGGCTSAPAMTTVIVHPPATVTIQLPAGNVILSWPAGTLQSATNVFGPWTEVPEATSSWAITPAAPHQFFRVKLQ